VASAPMLSIPSHNALWQAWASKHPHRSSGNGLHESGLIKFFIFLAIFQSALIFLSAPKSWEFFGRLLFPEQFLLF